MDNLKRAKNARLAYMIAGIACAVLGIASIVLVNTFMDARSYLWLVIFFIFSAVGLYGAVFLLFSAFDRAVAVRLIPIAEELGADNVTAISEVFGWQDSTTEKYVTKCRKWEYL